MRIYQDKFAPGDLVTWRDEYWATLIDSRQRHGDGPFMIDTVRDVSSRVLRSVGHTQHVRTFELGFDNVFSGAFFKKVGA